MRSRSSLLSHILGSNPDISGYMEMHQSYRNRLDLFKLAYKNLKYNDDKNDYEYTLDKILSNVHRINKRVLIRTDVTCLYLLREPLDTFKSMIDLGLITGIEWYKNPVEILEYYISRLKKMEEYSMVKKGNSYYINSDDLVDKPDILLQEISDFLSLKDKLTTNYKIFSNTGKPWFGDPSKNILSGIIVKKNTKNNYDMNDVQIPKEILDKAYKAYHSCHQTLMNNCLV